MVYLYNVSHHFLIILLIVQRKRIITWLFRKCESFVVIFLFQGVMVLDSEKMNRKILVAAGVDP